MSYTILLPTYNEKDNLPVVVNMLITSLRDEDVEILIIDDSSPDGTGEIADRLAEIYEPVSVLHRPAKSGLGTAYVDGTKNVKSTFVVIMDCDLSHDPRDVIRLIKKQRETGADVVAGTRYGGGAIVNWPVKRFFFSLGANTAAALLAGLHGVSDVTGSFRVYRRTVLQHALRNVKATGYAFQIDVLTQCQRSGASIDEVPIVFVDRLAGETKFSGKEVRLFGQRVLSLWLDR